MTRQIMCSVLRTKTVLLVFSIFIMNVTGRATTRSALRIQEKFLKPSKAQVQCDSNEPLGCADAVTPCFSPNGDLFLTWTQDHKVWFALSKDFGKTWTLPLRIGDIDSCCVAWRPQVIADAAGNVLVAYDTFTNREKHENREIRIAFSSDGGHHFSPTRPFETGSINQRLPVLDLTPDGRFLILWQEDKPQSGMQHAASVYYAWSKDGGRSFGPKAMAYPLSCPCCRIAVANSPGGLPVVVFRTIFSRGVRDHVVMSFDVSGFPGSIHRVAVDDWVVLCPHQSASIAVSSRGTIHVAWYTQGKVRQGLFYARSTDGGQHFGEPKKFGEVDGMASRPYIYAQGEVIWRVWKSTDDHATHVWKQVSHDDGLNWNTPELVANCTGYSDDPLVIGYGKHIFLSWLNREHGYQLISLEEPLIGLNQR